MIPWLCKTWGPTFENPMIPWLCKIWGHGWSAVFTRGFAPVTHYQVVDGANSNVTPLMPWRSHDW